ncbi:ABC transporter substrate-binding protein, partial [Rhizobium sp. CF142]|uniref:ABC transporter substrate-binding protein n=1 Tax=Rhizobium sp. CF142 TaxID=1144314 RepID=UPI00026F0362
MFRYFGKATAGMTVGLLLATSTAMAQDAGPVKIISSLPTLTSSATYLMEARGYDKAHGLTTEISQSGGSSSLQIDAVVAGSATFGAPGTATALQAIREGADIKIIGSIAKNQISAVIGNDALKKAGIPVTAPIADRIKAMKGMTIGTNPVGSTYYQMLRYYLQDSGIDPDNDVRLVGMGDSSALISGIEQGRFDAIVSASGVVEQAISLNAGQLWFSGARGDLPGGEDSVVCVVVARTDTIEKNPKLIEAFRAAMKDSLKAMREDRAETGKILRERFFTKLDSTVWETVWANAVDAYPSDFTFTKDAYDFWVKIDPKGADSYRNLD